jgi:hypothetical protein
MLPADSRGPLDLRLVVVSTAMIVATVGATILALLNLPQILVVGLALFAAVALIDVAGTLNARHQPGLREAPAERRPALPPR